MQDKIKEYICEAIYGEGEEKMLLEIITNVDIEIMQRKNEKKKKG